MIIPKYDSTAVGRRLRQARMERGLTQAKLAAMAGCSVASLRRLEQGKASLRVDMLLHLAALLDVQYDYFFTEEDREIYAERMCAQILHGLSLLDEPALRRLQAMVGFG